MLRRLTLTLLLTASLASAVSAAEPAPGKSKIRVLRNTTILLGPLDSQGYVDYGAAINKRFGQGVRPADNALVGYLELTGPDYGAPDEYYQALGMTKPKYEADYFCDWTLWADKKYGFGSPQSEQFGEEHFDVELSDWKTGKFPLVAEWLKDNEFYLNRFLEVTKRSRYYRPLVPQVAVGASSDNGKPYSPWLGLAVDAEGVEDSKSIAEALKIRAQMRIAERQFVLAREDILAMHRWGRLLASGPTAADIKAGYQVEVNAAWTRRKFIEQVGTDVEEIRPLLKELLRLPPLPPPTAELERSSRYIFLDAVQRTAQADFIPLRRLDYLRSRNSKVGEPTPADIERFAKIDYEKVMRDGNKWFDRAQAAMKVPDRTKEERAADLMELEQEQSKKKFADRDETATSVLNLIHDGELAEYLVAAFHPKPANLRWWIEWAAQESDFIVVAYALALHRAEVGRYPDRLAELKPLYLPSIPRDRYAGDELKYRRDGRKYALYNVGRNGIDEGGKNGFFNQDSTDTSDDEFFRLRVGSK